MDSILGIRKSLVRINQENMEGDLILESLALAKTALLMLQREVSRCHARGNSFLFPETRSYSTNSLNRTRQYFHIIFLIPRLTWWNKFFVNDSLTVEECDKHHFVF
jgi:hypothetical protein